MIGSPRIRAVPVVVAFTLAFGTVLTAYGLVKPLPERPLPPATTVTTAVALELPAIPATGGSIQSERIRLGDTLQSVLGRMDIIDPELVEFVIGDEIARAILAFRAGETLHAELDAMGHASRLVYSKGIVDARESPVGLRIVVERDADGRLSAHDQTIEVERGIALRTATIKSTLFGATHSAGIPESVASQIADILGGEIDLYRDLRRGDRLEVIYETLAEPDSLELPQGGRVLALRFINGKRELTAFHFDADGNGGEYYDINGNSLRKTFLRYPIEFSRISSRFTDARLHPVLGVVRAHKGVDFAAPAGTPIRSTGDGIVDFVGQQRGYGKVVILRHDGNYSTLYAHMSGFARHLRKGDKIRQGAVIGFVGSTGYATGPHLHYEFRIGKEQADPLAADLPVAAPLGRAALARFDALAADFTERFGHMGELQLARFE
ncbi:MAG: peptidoglycan DD-metalloendopeptidase family protein [Burkholderiaceae bacterium]